MHTLSGWCGRVGKAIALDTESVGFKCKRRHKFSKPFWIFLVQLCIQHDELGWLVAGLTRICDHQNGLKMQKYEKY